MKAQQEMMANFLLIVLNGIETQIILICKILIHTFNRTKWN